MKYYRKMLFTFGAISVIYTLLIEAFFLTAITWSNKRDFAMNTDTAASSVSEYTDTRLQYFRQTSHMIRISDYTNKYMAESPSSPDRYSRLKLHSLMRTVSGVAPTYMHNFAITKLYDNYVLMPDSTGNLDWLYQRFGLGESSVEAIREAFSRQSNLPFVFLESQTESAGKYVLVRQERMGRPSPLYVFASYRRDQLFNLPQLENATLAIFFGDRLIASAGPLQGEALAEELTRTEDGSLFRRDIASGVQGIRYVYLAMPRSFLLTPATAIIGAAGAAAILVGLVIMYLLTKRMYHPIETVLEELDFHAGKGDEFGHMRNAVRGLRERLDEMGRSLRTYSDDARNKLFHGLLTGLLSPDEGAAQFKALDIPLEEGDFTAVLVRYVDEPGLDDAYTQGMGARELLAAALSDEDALYRLVGLSYSSYGLIFREGDTARLAERMRHILLSIEPESGLEIFAFVGKPCKGLVNIYESYRTAMRMSGHSEFEPLKAKVLTYGALPPAESTRALYYPLELEQSLINGIVSGKSHAWRSAVLELMEANRSGGDQGQLSLMLTATVNRIIDSVNRSPLDFFEEETVIYLELRSCRTIDELRDKALSLLEQIAGRIERFRQTSTQGLYEKMTDFLHENYAKNISLYDLADHLNMSRNYVSTLFKSSTGQNFKDYLGQYRYRMACEIMTQNPGIRIREVADRVGCNADSFARLFARHSGVTPREYQRSQMNG